MRFSLKDLFISTGLIAVGVGCVTLNSHWVAVPKFPGFLAPLLLVMYFAGFVSIGGGLFLPFKKVGLGMGIGMVAAILAIPIFFAD